MWRFINALYLALASTAFSVAAYAQVACCPNTPVPEPASLSLLAVGVGGILLAKRYRRTSRVVSFLAVAAAVALWANAGMSGACTVCIP